MENPAARSQVDAAVLAAATDPAAACRVILSCVRAVEHEIDTSFPIARKVVSAILEGATFDNTEGGQNYHQLANALIDECRQVHREEPERKEPIKVLDHAARALDSIFRKGSYFADMKRCADIAVNLVDAGTVLDGMVESRAITAER